MADSDKDKNTKPDENNNNDDSSDSSADSKNTDTSDEHNKDKDDKSVPLSRFSEVNKKKNELQAELDTLKKEKEEAEAKQLAESGKFKELYEKEQEKNKTLEIRMVNQKKESSLRAKAQEMGAIYPDLVTSQINLDEVEIDDATGEVKGADELLKKVHEARPKLFDGEKSKSIGNDVTDTSTKDGKPIYKWSELKQKMTDVNWLEENKKEYEAAKAEGRIDFNA